MFWHVTDKDLWLLATWVEINNNKWLDQFQNYEYIIFPMQWSMEQPFVLTLHCAQTHPNVYVNYGEAKLKIQNFWQFLMSGWQLPTYRSDKRTTLGSAWPPQPGFDLNSFLLNPPWIHLPFFLPSSKHSSFYIDLCSMVDHIDDYLAQTESKRIYLYTIFISPSLPFSF